MSQAVMLSIAGSDCSAGAGLQADLKTGAALGCYPLTILTCAVSEVPGKVQSIIPMEPDFVAEQLRLCMKNFPVAAIKTGMLYSPEIVRAVAGVLEELDYRGPLVIDPVMIATAGEPLMQQQALAAYEECLFPKATLLTPNLDELSVLMGGGCIESRLALEHAARSLCTRYGCAVLAKGGHLAGRECVDVLASCDAENHAWTRERINGVNTHGTGCTLSSAIAAQLAQGHSLIDSVETGLDYVATAIRNTSYWESPVSMQALGCRFATMGNGEWGIGN